MQPNGGELGSQSCLAELSDCQVSSIVTDDDASSLSFILVGRMQGKATAVTVDFSQYHQRICSGEEDAGT